MEEKMICLLRPEDPPDILISEEKGRTIYTCPEKTFGLKSPCMRCRARKMSNYEITKRRVQEDFRNQDQEMILQKTGLAANETYIYLNYIQSNYRVHRVSGLVQREERDGSWRECDFNEVLTIMDLLCYAKPGAVSSGEYTALHSLASVQQAIAYAGSGMFDAEAAYFDTHTEELKKACLALGGVSDGQGEVAYRIHIYGEMSVILQFWNSDEDFPANLQIMCDKNLLQYMHYETVWYMAGTLIQRLKENMI